MYKVCRHIRTSGGRCRAAALRNENFCYYHLSQRHQSITLDLPPLEDRTSIQIAVSRVLASLAAGLIDRRDAGMYLYGIQIAASNLPHDTSQIEPRSDVRRVILTRTRDQVAEVQTIVEAHEVKGHKKDCKCDKCWVTETDTPHHPECRCGECHYFAEEEPEISEASGPQPQPEDQEPEPQEAGPLTLQAVAEGTPSPGFPPSASSWKPKQPHAAFRQAHLAPQTSLTS